MFLGLGIVTWALEHYLRELDALGDIAANPIYPGNEGVIANRSTMGRWVTVEGLALLPIRSEI